MRALLLALAAVALMVGCGSDSNSSLPEGSEEVKLDPADFVDRVDNAYWPMAPGSRWLYREGEQRSDVTVTDKTKEILGISATVVHDLVTEHGELIEDTLDWYAQDKDGNVWYLGEATTEYENGRANSTEGSWQAGVDGAQPGIIVAAEPKAGLTYRQEYYRGHAEDAAGVLSVDELAQVPYGFFKQVLMTKDYTPLEPRLLEHKFYARGVGPVLTLTVSGGSDREELVRFTKPVP